MRSMTRCSLSRTAARILLTGFLGSRPMPGPRRSLLESILVGAPARAFGSTGNIHLVLSEMRPIRLRCDGWAEAVERRSVVFLTTHGLLVQGAAAE